MGTEMSQDLRICVARMFALGCIHMYVLVDLVAERARLEGRYVTVLGELASRDGVQSAAWQLREYTRMNSPQARSEARLAEALLEHEFTDELDALSAGEIQMSHAKVDVGRNGEVHARQTAGPPAAPAGPRQFQSGGIGATALKAKRPWAAATAPENDASASAPLAYTIGRGSAPSNGRGDAYLSRDRHGSLVREGTRGDRQPCCSQPNRGCPARRRHSQDTCRYARSWQTKRRVSCSCLGGDHRPIFLLAAFARNERVDLSPKERQGLIRVADRIRSEYGGSQ